jgi:hypothetical protein
MCLFHSIKTSRCLFVAVSCVQADMDGGAPPQPSPHLCLCLWLEFCPFWPLRNWSLLELRVVTVRQTHFSFLSSFFVSSFSFCFFLFLPSLPFLLPFFFFLSISYTCLRVLADMGSVDGWGSIPQARSVMGRGWSLLQSRTRCRLTTCLLRTWQACV